VKASVTGGRLVWLVLVCLGGVLLVPAGRCGEDPEKKAAELEQLRQRIGALQSELQANQQKKTRAERELQDAEQLIGAARRALRKTGLELGDLGKQLSNLKADRQTSTATLHHQSSELAREALAAYAMGRQQQIKLLLNQEQPSAVGRMLVYFSYLSRARQAKIEAMQSTLQHLEAVKEDIQLKSEALTALQEEQRQQAARLEVQRQKREQVLAQVTAQLHSQGGELRRLQQDEKQLQALVHSLQELLSDIPADASQQKPFKALKGRLRWPARGQLVKRFGSLRGNSGLKWQGVLIEAPEGGQVRAVSQGRVAFADWMRGFGLLLIIDHGDGYMSLYGQNEALYKEVGEWVDSGEVVATLGASGGQTEAGLYFEIRHNGQPVNPLNWCAGKPAAVSG
jgi:septal ring factor EnvC (AmiA/AmiB activator)